MRRHILSIGIVLCLALALQAPARAAVQMRLPSLKKYYLDTVLVSNGAAASAIVAPDAPGYADLAGDVRRAIKDLTGAELPVITDAAADAELAQAGGGRRAMIVLGNISVNKVSERLYVMEQVDVDAGWPGAGGYLLQTVHDPMGDGRNFISLGGSDLKGAQGAAQAFIDSLKPDGRSLKVGRLFKLEGTYKGPAPLTVAHVNRKGYGSPNAAVSHAGECAHILRRYRTPGYGRMFRHAMERIAAAIKNGEEWEDRDANCGELPLLWDIIEECEEFDAKDEADVILQGEELADNGNSMFDDPGKNTLDDRTFISDIMYAHAQIQDLVKGARDQGAGKNSGAGISGLYAGLYFNKYYPGLEIGGKLLKNADFFFSSPIKHWRVIDNATGYGDMVWYANLQYSLLRPNMAYFSSGIARKAADYHIIITSNLGRSGGFGDSLSWTKGHFSYHPVLYPMCAWYYRDGSYLWWFRKCGGRAGTYLGHYSSSMLAGRYIVSGLEEKPPVRWLGVKPYPLDHWMYRAWKAQEPEEEHAHRYFDKMSFRAGFEATNQYLQLSGFSGSAHGHPDANGIINFSDNGCDFLDDTGYMIPDINEHTTLIVFRNGMGSDGPGLVQIDNIADFDDVAFTETTASGHNRTKWSRNIIWEKERYFAVFDEVEAEEDGEVGIVCVWRVNGGISLKGRELTATHGKQAMRLINMGGPRLRTSDVRLFQTQDAAMKKGEKTVIANLFYAAGPSDDLSIDIERLASNAMLVKQNGEFKVIGVGPCSAIAGLETDAALFHAGARAVHVSGCAKLSMPGFSLRSDKPVSAYLDLEKGTGVVEAAEVARVVLGSGAETVLDAGKGRTAIRFAPVPAERLAERVAPLPGLFAATAAARREEDARAEAARKAETELLKSRISVIWEARDLKAAGGPAGGSETRDLAKLLDGGDLSDVSQIMKASKQDGLEMVDGARSEMEGMKGVQWLETADRDGDGKSEILAGTASGYVTSLSHEGKPVWSTATVSIPALRGISGELRAVIGPPGDRKIITASGNKAWLLSCIDAGGERLWETSLPLPPLTLYASEPNAAGEFEIGMGAFEYAYGFSHKGRQLWKYLNQVKHPSTCGAAYDLDGDGASEMTIGNDYYSGHILRGRTGQRIGSFSMTWHAGPSAVAMGDLDGDGKGDIVIGDRMGYMEFCVPWNTKARAGCQISAIITVIKFADLDGDGKKEVIVGADSGMVYVFDAAARQLFRFDAGDAPRDIDFGDLDGDGRKDFLLDCRDRCMRVIDGNGRKMAMFSVKGGVRFVRAVELDGNKKASECVVAGADGCVYALKFNAAGGAK